MKRAIQFAIVCFCAFASANASSGAESPPKGTVAIVDVLENEVVFAADSRVTKDDGSYTDDDCKILTLKDDAIFVSGGPQRRVAYRYGTAERALDSYVLAKKAIELRRTKRRSDTLASFAANYWAIHEKQFFEEISVTNPNFSPIDMDLVSAGFASRDATGDLSVYFADVRLAKGQHGRVQVNQIVEPRLAGQGELPGNKVIVQEFLHHGQSERAKAAILQWEKTLPRSISSQDHDERFDLQLIQWTVDLSHQAMIGGDVNAVVLDRKGRRWPAQKQYCRH